MLRVLHAYILMLGILIPGTAMALDPVAVEVEMARLQGQIQDRKEAADWEGALDLIGGMAALDPDHPKPYIQLVLLQASRRKLDDAPGLMERLGLIQGPGRVYGEAMVSAFQRSFDKAAEGFLRALEMYQPRDHAAGQAACHTALGNLHKFARRFDAAVAEYEAAIPLLEGIEDGWGLTDVLGNLAQVESRRGHPEAALDHQRAILALRVELGDREGQARSWHEIGSALSGMGDQAGAVPALERAIALRRDLGDAPAQISSIQRLGTVRLAAGQGDLAVSGLREALGIARAIPDARLAADVSRQLGETLIDIGQAGAAIEVLEAAVETFRSLEEGGDETRALIGLGRALSRMGEMGKARLLLLQALAGAEKLDERRLVAAACTALGNVHLAAGEMSQAILAQERALELNRQLEDRDGQRTNLHNLGAVYFALGDLERSRRTMEQTLALAEELNDTEATARAHNNLGVLLAELGKLDEALPELEEAIRLWRTLDAPRSEANSQANLAELLAALGRGDAAASRLEMALAGFRAVEDRRGEASALNQLGEFRLSGGQPEEALQAHGEALRLGRVYGLPDQRWRAHAGLAAGRVALGQPEAALEEALLALDEIEAVRGNLELDTFKMRFLAGKIGHYERALALLLATPGQDGRQTGDAVSRSFHLAERARARGLLDLLAESGASLRDDMDPVLQEQETRILDDLSAGALALGSAGSADERAAARARLDGAEAELERLQMEIRRAAPRYGGIVYPSPATLETIRQEVLGDDEVLLEYFIGESQAWLWVISRRNARLYPLAPPDEIQAAVSRFLAEVDSSGAGLGGGVPGEVAAVEIAGMILPPDPLPAGSRLVVVADGPLHHIPFGALRDGDRFLVEAHEISVAPSATALRLMRETPIPVAEGGFLGVADPIPAAGDERFTRLPHTRQEVETIAALFPESGRDLLSGEEATKAGIRALDLARFRYLHFATHGWLDGDDLRHSGLRLSAAGGEEGAALLSLNEILAMDLSAEVVVLSACRSGIGELLRGEGLVSLTRAFLYAGSRTVVVSLWNVGDQSTADFMQVFYRGLERGASPAAALRQAKLSFLASDRPGRRWIRRWAPFVLVGDPGYPDTGLNPEADAPTE